MAEPRKQVKGTNGFTLLEVIMALIVIGVITTLTLLSFRAGGRQIRLALEAEKVALALRRTQNLASATKEFIPEGEASAVKPFGYGVFFNIDSDGSRKIFTLFADLNDSKTFDASRERLENVELGPDVIISGLSYVRLTVFFVPPAPLIKFFNGPAEASVPAVTVTLGLASDPSVRKQITVRASGEIDVTTP